MKNRISLLICVLIGVVLIQYRFSYTDFQSGKPLKITTWDAFGYYMYLPSTVIYGDVSELEWLPEIDSTYQLTGGELYQANRHTHGNYVNKYLGGVSLMQAPFFFVAHIIALNSHYNADGFSPPYQYAIAFAAIFYCLLGLLIMRNILLRFYSDLAVGLSILLMVLATNLIQYVAIDSAMSHVFIFPLYALVIYATIKWHEKPELKWAMVIGFLIGVATISRPTEAIMLFIPLLWNTHTKEAAKAKWRSVKLNKTHVLTAILFGVIGVLPQLIYWKITSGSFVYNVGSKWFFLNPFFRVLFGFENGWFIYTPITVLFIVGFFFMKNKPFRRSVIVFCLLNIWIVIAWSDWKYGATYSTRALTQSYPVFLLPLTGIISHLLKTKWKYISFPVFGFLLYANLFQIWQYNTTVLHYREMNRQYYASIYLDSNPSPLDMSLLDTDEILTSTSEFNEDILYDQDTISMITNTGEYPDILAKSEFSSSAEGWIKVEAKIQATEGKASSYLNCKLVNGDVVKEKAFRLSNPITKDQKVSSYAFFVRIPDSMKDGEVLVFTSSLGHFSGELQEIKVTQFTKKG